MAELAAEIRRVAHGAVPVSDDSLCNEGSEVVIVLPADTLDGDGDVSSRHGVVPNPDLRTNEVGLLFLSLCRGLGRVVRGFRGKVRKVLLGEVDKLLVGNTASSHENHAVGSVISLDVVLQVGTLKALDVLLGAEDCPSERLALESGGVEVVEDDFLELLVDLLLLPENDVALALNSLGLELRVLENIGEDVDRGGYIGVEGLGVVDGVLALQNISMCPVAVSNT